MLKPLRDATATGVVKYLEREVFHTFGVPEFVHSDNGRQFESKLFNNFLESYGVKHIKTAVYSPQANASERVNRSILQILRAYINNDQRSWDKYISDVAFALRSAKHSAINLEPYTALFGLHMMQHGAAYDISRRLKALGQEEFPIERRNEKQQLMHEWILNKLKAAHEKASRHYNLRSREIKYKEGQIVFRKNFKQSNLAEGYNAKLGPVNLKCIVLRCVGKSLYELANMSGKSIGVYHAKDLFSS